MKRFALILFVIPISAFAEDPFSCVDPDIADAFLGHWNQGRPTYSSSVPADFLNTELPTNLELIGSSVSGSMTTVVYKSKANPDEALASTMEVLKNAGWKDLSESHYQRRGGFQVGPKPVSTALCHDSKAGSISVVAKKGSNSTLLSLVAYRQNQPRTCDEQRSESRMHHRGPELHKYLPVLRVPAKAKASNIGSGGGGDEYSAHVVVSSTMGRAELMSYFDDKIRDQQWVPDAAWSGSTSSGTVWTKTDEDGKGMVGVLRIADAAADVYNVRFTVSSVDPGKHFSGSSSSSE